MAIVKMKKLRAISLAARRDELLKELMLLGCVELSTQTELLSDPEAGQFLTADHGALMETQAERQMYAEALAVLDRHVPQKTPLLSAKPEISVETLLDESEEEKVSALAQDINAQSERLKALAAEETREKLLIETLSPWRGCALPLDCAGTSHVAVTFGMLPPNADMDALSARLQSEAAAELYEVSADLNARYIYLIHLRAETEDVLRILREFGFTAPAWGETGPSAAEGVAAAERRLADIAAERERVLQTIKDGAECRELLRRAYDFSGTKVDRAEAAGRLLKTQSANLLSGWCPAEREADVTRLLQRFDCAYEFTDPSPEEYPETPVSLKNGPVTRSLNTVTNMYSLPAYNSVDPNPLMAPFFIFFYGMMMADMGYGLLMILGCLVVLKKRKPNPPHFFELFLWCGIATFVWGIFTASFFGDAVAQAVQILSPGSTFTWFWQPLIVPTDHALQLLIGSLVLGVIQIFTGMAVSVYLKFKRGQVMDALCNEIAWYLVFILGAIGILANCLMPMIIAIIVLLLLTQGYGKKGIGIFTGIFGSLYNHITGYFSDILSYSRLMALMLAGAVIAQVFNQLGALTGNIVMFLIIAIVGNGLNMALNLLGCYVHDMRLQCLEFFGYFYEDGGRRFQPLKVNTKYVEVNKS